VWSSSPFSGGQSGGGAFVACTEVIAVATTTTATCRWAGSTCGRGVGLVWSSSSFSGGRSGGGTFVAWALKLLPSPPPPPPLVGGWAACTVEGSDQCGGMDGMGSSSSFSGAGVGAWEIRGVLEDHGITATLLHADRAGAGDVLLLLRACFVPAVRDLLALDCSARATLLCADCRCRRCLAVAAPALGAPSVRRACCARCPCVWSLGVGDAPLRRSCRWSARSCCGRSRPGSSMGRRVHCARCGRVWSTCPQKMSQRRSARVTCSPHRLRRSSARSCRGFSRPGSSARTSCPL
jgi:hypothetical protein